MSVEDVACRETRDALDCLARARRARIAGEVREVEVLAGLAADPDPYRDDRGQLGKEWIVEDVACVLRVPSVTAAAKLRVAGLLVTRFAGLFAAVRAGRIELRYAVRAVELAEQLPDSVLGEFHERVLAHCDTATFSQFLGRVRRTVAALDTRTADEQHRAAMQLRRVVFTPADHGMTELWAMLPATGAAALKSVLQQAADADRHDGRSADHRRADALCALATSGPAAASAGLRPRVLVTVPASTLLGADDQPGDLAGHGPITAAAARALAYDPTATWRRLLTDPAGNLIDLGSTSYRPPAPLRRFVQLRDQTCRFLTCNRRAEHCELDHVRAHADGGPTTATNLIALCSRHHHLKHDGRWTITRRPDGSITWTSPTGHHWISPPPDPLHSG